jgi:hypothetical protein
VLLCNKSGYITDGEKYNKEDVSAIQLTSNHEILSWEGVMKDNSWG